MQRHDNLVEYNIYMKPLAVKTPHFNHNTVAATDTTALNAGFSS